MYNLNLKCNNYEICETRLPDLWGRTNYLCYNCDMLFGSCTLDGKKGRGTLEFYNNLECPNCKWLQSAAIPHQPVNIAMELGSIDPKEVHKCCNCYYYILTIIMLLGLK